MRLYQIIKFDLFVHYCKKGYATKDQKLVITLLQPLIQLN
jgi:hypothetical protein